MPCVLQQQNSGSQFLRALVHGFAREMRAGVPAFARAEVERAAKDLPVFAVEDIKIIARWKAVGFYDKRLQVLVLLLVDTGARISEAPGLKWSDVDFDNLLVTLHGKLSQAARHSGRLSL